MGYYYIRFVVQLLLFVISAQPPSCLGDLCVHFVSAYLVQQCGSIGFGQCTRALDHHHELVVGSPWMEVVFLNERCKLAQVAESKYHTYRGTQYGELEGDRNEGRQRQMGLTANIERPATGEDPTHEAERDGSTGDAVDEAGGMQARFTQAHGMVEPMHRERRVHIVDLKAGLAYFFHRRKKHFLIIKKANNEFSYIHIMKLVNSK